MRVVKLVNVIEPVETWGCQVNMDRDELPPVGHVERIGDDELAVKVVVDKVQVEGVDDELSATVVYCPLAHEDGDRVVSVLKACGYTKSM